MVLRRGTGALEHATIADLARYLEPGTVVVLNDTRVRKARLFGSAASSGATVEFLLLEPGEDHTWRAMVSRGKRQRPGKHFNFPGGVVGTILREAEDTKIIRFSEGVDDAYLEQHGHVPLPPYIHRDDEPDDADRYQTVYARAPGSVAAPTAGLHLTPEILAELGRGGAHVVTLTLHVGLGTFAPIRTEDIESHRMHVESYVIGPEAARTVSEAKGQGRPVLAVGTTVMRTLESAWDATAGALRPGAGSTDLFIRPGHVFQVATQMLTNFHTPRSSLLVLVSAFAGRTRILDAYAQAVDSGYRFYSYGDAMLIL
jgi:S-adenosylmethionine:tRNA ribosyltransferase-isomerase